MDILSTDMNSMLNSMSSWWGPAEKKAPEETSKSKSDTASDTKPPEVTDTPENSTPAETETTPAAPSTEKGEEGKNKEETPKTEKGADIDIEEMSAKAVTAAKEWGSYLFTFGKTATQQVTDQVTKTAKQIKDTIDEKTMIGDFNKIQSEFVEERQEKKKKSEAAVPPWVGYNEEEAMKSQILALSSDRRNFLRNPPAGVQFNFDFEGSFPVAMAMLQEDPDLKKMRFDLVPKQVKEITFWRNYFYRVSLIKQSAQLTSLAQQTGSSADTPSRVSPARTDDSTKEEKSLTKTDCEAKSSGTVTSGSKEDEKDGEDFHPGSPTEHEFISDAFQENQIIEDDFKKEMQQLGMTDKEEDIPEWEKELQAELQEYEVVNDGNGLEDDDLEQEILDQLEAESNGEEASSKE